MTLYTGNNQEVVELSDGNAYSLENVDFVDCIRKDRESEINPPEASLETLKLALAEMESAKTRKPFFCIPRGFRGVSKGAEPIWSDSTRRGETNRSGSASGTG